MGGCCSHPSIWVKKSYIQLNECVGREGGGGLGDIQINESFFTLFFIKLTSLALIIIRLSLVLVYYTEEAGIELNDVQSGNHYVKMLNFPKRIHYIFFYIVLERYFWSPDYSTNVHQMQNHMLALT